MYIKLFWVLTSLLSSPLSFINFPVSLIRVLLLHPQGKKCFPLFLISLHLAILFISFFLLVLQALRPAYFTVQTL